VLPLSSVRAPNSVFSFHPYSWSSSYAIFFYSPTPHCVKPPHVVPVRDLKAVGMLTPGSSLPAFDVSPSFRKCPFHFLTGSRCSRGVPSARVIRRRLRVFLKFKFSPFPLQHLVRFYPSLEALRRGPLSFMQEPGDRFSGRISSCTRAACVLLSSPPYHPVAR